MSNYQLKIESAILDAIENKQWACAIEQANTLNVDTAFAAKISPIKKLLDSLKNAVSQNGVVAYYASPLAIRHRELALALLNNTVLQQEYSQINKADARLLVSAFMLYRTEDLFADLAARAYPQKTIAALGLLHTHERNLIIENFIERNQLVTFIGLLSKINSPSILNFLSSTIHNLLNITVGILSHSVQLYFKCIEITFVGMMLVAGTAMLTAAALVIPAAVIALLPFAAALSIAASMLTIPLFISAYSVLVGLLSPLILLGDSLPLFYVGLGSILALTDFAESTIQSSSTYQAVVNAWDKSAASYLDDSYRDNTSPVPRSWLSSSWEGFLSSVSGMPEESEKSRHSVRRMSIFALKKTDSMEESAYGHEPLVKSV